MTPSRLNARLHAWLLASSAALLLLSPTALLAQGRDGYFNVESPQVDSIEVATIVNSAEQSRRLLFTCNTPNSTVEVFDLESGADEPPLVATIPVGLEPVSLLVERYATTNGDMVNSLFTANYLGDSVSYIDLDFVLDDGFSLRTTHKGTIDVGDAPTDLAFRSYPQTEIIGDVEGPRLFVAKRTESSYAVLRPDPEDFAVVQRDIRLTVNVPLGSSFFTFGLKEPHAILVHPTRPELWVLGHQGGSGVLTTFLDRQDVDDCLGSDNAPPSGALLNSGTTGLPAGATLPPFDLDICVVDITDPDADQDFILGTPEVNGIGALGTMESAPAQDPNDLIPGLATTNFNMAFSTDGDRLYVVGTRARTDVKGEAALSSLPTGFSETMLYQVNASSAPVDIDLAAMTNAWNVNETIPGFNGSPVPPELSLAHLTDLEVGPPVTSGNLTFDQLWVTAFNSDNFATLYTKVSAPQDAALFPFRTNLFNAAATNIRDQLRGPRSLAVDLADNATVYFMNRIEDSISIARQVSANNYAFDESDVIPLTNPEPAYIADGRRFMYSTRFSGNGFVSCASCHIDGRSDQQAWLLDAGGSAAFQLAFEAESSDNPAPNTFGEKGHMVTQSLQGLTNFEMNVTRMPAPNGFPTPQNQPNNAREFDLVSNAPYHWRGDKPTFLDFNGTYVNLHGMPVGANTCATGLGPGEAATATTGLCDEEMAAYEQFVMSMHYEPNNLQPDDRSYDTLAAEGLRVFHEEEGPGALLGNRSCVQCHSLPEGSNNRIVNVRRNDFSNDTGIVDPTTLFPLQVLETAALRGMRQKEAFLELDNLPRGPGALFLGTGIGGARTGDFGLTRQGVEVVPIQNGARLSLNQFEAGNPNSQAVIEFVRQFDHSVAPVVGSSFTVAMIGGVSVVLDDKLSSDTPTVALNKLITEAHDANAEVVVHFDSTDVGTSFESFAYNVGSALFEGSAGSSNSASALLGLVNSPGDRLLIQAVPLGSGRRMAGLSAGAGAPRPIQIGTVPNEAYGQVPTFTGNFSDGPTNKLPNTEAFCDLDPLSLNTLRSFLSQLKQSSLPLAGVTQILPGALRHDAPRRLRFIAESGSFQAGSVVRLYVHHNDAAPTTNPNSSTLLELPIFETDETMSGQAIWETAVEFDPSVLYSLLAGGPFAPGVSKAWTQPKIFFVVGGPGGTVFERFPNPGEPGGIDAEVWNNYAWETVDPQGTVSPLITNPLVY